ncbi:hypothetical protein [Flavimarina sp. Hel_I_48]|uniref:hypothetical protein n=1 Tax=Flavimarina sp. Hel_I_48 TaxID=1392488 RepID=UPI0013DA8E3D|nr:hypothetical protein [Flavimarina sp. Hel_I_48]
MKKSILIILTVFLNLALFSCSPEKLNEELQNTQACCGDDEPIPPPPPPDEK